MQARQSRVGSQEAAPHAASEELMTLRAILDAERTAHEQQLVEVRQPRRFSVRITWSCKYNGVCAFQVEHVVAKLSTEQQAVENTIRSLHSEKDALLTDLQAVSLERDHLRKALNDFASARSRSGSAVSHQHDTAVADPAISTGKPPLLPVGTQSSSAMEPRHEGVASRRRPSDASVMSTVSSNSRTLDNLLEQIQQATASHGVPKSKPADTKS